jgi:hypothetical protein
VSSKTPSIAAISAHNKCDSKYTMRSATKVQNFDLLGAAIFVQGQGER